MTYSEGRRAVHSLDILYNTAEMQSVYSHGKSYRKTSRIPNQAQKDESPEISPSPFQDSKYPECPDECLDTVERQPVC